jgi:response regulator RpfG family c-di-GMP phosphodiesterase
MDSQMPEMDGAEAASEIRRMEGSQRHTPVIALTASARQEDRERCLAAGMDDYLVKPVGDSDVVRMVDRWVTRARPVFDEFEQLHGGDTVNNDVLDTERLNELMSLADDDPGWFAECVKSFVRETELGMARMRDAIDRGDMKTLAAISHEYKGTCANIGANAMANTCKELERASKQGSLDDAARRVEQLGHEFMEARSALERHQAAAQKTV